MSEKIYTAIMSVLALCMVALFLTITTKMWTGGYVVTTHVTACPE